ncbi:MAG: hypothetical protein RLN62_05475 [Rickettsiales bacterium]
MSGALRRKARKGLYAAATDATVSSRLAAAGVFPAAMRGGFGMHSLPPSLPAAYPGTLPAVPIPGFSQKELVEYAASQAIQEGFRSGLKAAARGEPAVDSGVDEPLPPPSDRSETAREEADRVTKKGTVEERRRFFGEKPIETLDQAINALKPEERLKVKQLLSRVAQSGSADELSPSDPALPAFMKLNDIMRGFDPNPRHQLSPEDLERIKSEEIVGDHESALTSLASGFGLSARSTFGEISNKIEHSRPYIRFLYRMQGAMDKAVRQAAMEKEAKRAKRAAVARRFVDAAREIKAKEKATVGLTRMAESAPKSPGAGPILKGPRKTRAVDKLPVAANEAAEAEAKRDALRKKSEVRAAQSKETARAKLAESGPTTPVKKRLSPIEARAEAARRRKALLAEAEADSVGKMTAKQEAAAKRAKSVKDARKSKAAAHNEKVANAVKRVKEAREAERKAAVDSFVKSSRDVKKIVQAERKTLSNPKRKLKPSPSAVEAKEQRARDAAIRKSAAAKSSPAPQPVAPSGPAKPEKPSRPGRPRKTPAVLPEAAPSPPAPRPPSVTAPARKTVNWGRKGGGKISSPDLSVGHSMADTATPVRRGAKDTKSNDKPLKTQSSPSVESAAAKSSPAPQPVAPSGPAKPEKPARPGRPRKASPVPSLSAPAKPDKPKRSASRSRSTVSGRSVSPGRFRRSDVDSEVAAPKHAGLKERPKTKEPREKIKARSGAVQGPSRSDLSVGHSMADTATPVRRGAKETKSNDKSLKTQSSEAAAKQVLREQSAAARIQEAGKGFVAKTKAKRELAERRELRKLKTQKAAATKLQAVAKGRAAKSAYESTKAAAIKTQAAKRGNDSRRHLAESVAKDLLQAPVSHIKVADKTISFPKGKGPAAQAELAGRLIKAQKDSGVSLGSFLAKAELAHVTAQEAEREAAAAKLIKSSRGVQQKVRGEKRKLSKPADKKKLKSSPGAVKAAEDKKLAEAKRAEALKELKSAARNIAPLQGSRKDPEPSLKKPKSKELDKRLPEVDEASEDRELASAATKIQAAARDHSKRSVARKAKTAQNREERIRKEAIAAAERQTAREKEAAKASLKEMAKKAPKAADKGPKLPEVKRGRPVKKMPLIMGEGVAEQNQKLGRTIADAQARTAARKAIKDVSKTAAEVAAAKEAAKSVGKEAASAAIKRAKAKALKGLKSIPVPEGSKAKDPELSAHKHRKKFKPVLAMAADEAAEEKAAEAAKAKAARKAHTKGIKSAKAARRKEDAARKLHEMADRKFEREYGAGLDKDAREKEKAAKSIGDRLRGEGAATMLQAAFKGKATRAQLQKESKLAQELAKKILANPVGPLEVFGQNISMPREGGEKELATRILNAQRSSADGFADFIKEAEKIHGEKVESSAAKKASKKASKRRSAHTKSVKSARRDQFVASQLEAKAAREAAKAEKKVRRDGKAAAEAAAAKAKEISASKALSSLATKYGAKKEADRKERAAAARDAIRAERRAVLDRPLVPVSALENGLRLELPKQKLPRGLRPFISSLAVAENGIRSIDPRAMQLALGMAREMERARQASQTLMIEDAPKSSKVPTAAKEDKAPRKSEPKRSTSKALTTRKPPVPDALMDRVTHAMLYGGRIKVPAGVGDFAVKINGVPVPLFKGGKPTKQLQAMARAFREARENPRLIEDLASPEVGGAVNDILTNVVHDRPARGESSPERDGEREMSGKGEGGKKSKEDIAKEVEAAEKALESSERRFKEATRNEEKAKRSEKELAEANAALAKSRKSKEKSDTALAKAEAAVKLAIGNLTKKQGHAKLTSGGSKKERKAAKEAAKEAVKKAKAELTKAKSDKAIAEKTAKAAAQEQSKFEKSVGQKDTLAKKDREVASKGGGVSAAKEALRKAEHSLGQLRREEFRINPEKLKGVNKGLGAKSKGADKGVPYSDSELASTSRSDRRKKSKDAKRAARAAAEAQTAGILAEGTKQIAARKTKIAARNAPSPAADAAPESPKPVAKRTSRKRGREEIGRGLRSSDMSPAARAAAVETSLSEQLGGPGSDWTDPSPLVAPTTELAPPPPPTEVPKGVGDEASRQKAEPASAPKPKLSTKRNKKSKADKPLDIHNKQQMAAARRKVASERRRKGREAPAVRLASAKARKREIKLLPEQSALISNIADLASRSDLSHDERRSELKPVLRKYFKSFVRGNEDHPTGSLTDAASYIAYDKGLREDVEDILPDILPDVIPDKGTRDRVVKKLGIGKTKAAGEALMEAGLIEAQEAERVHGKPGRKDKDLESKYSELKSAAFCERDPKKKREALSKAVDFIKENTALKDASKKLSALQTHAKAQGMEEVVESKKAVVKEAHTTARKQAASAKAVKADVNRTVEQVRKAGGRDAARMEAAIAAAKRQTAEEGLAKEETKREEKRAAAAAAAADRARVEKEGLPEVGDRVENKTSRRAAEEAKRIEAAAAERAAAEQQAMVAEDKTPPGEGGVGTPRPLAEGGKSVAPATEPGKGGAGKPKPTAKPEEKVRDEVTPGEGGAGKPKLPVKKSRVRQTADEAGGRASRTGGSVRRVAEPGAADHASSRSAAEKAAKDAEAAREVELNKKAEAFRARKDKERALGALKSNVASAKDEGTEPGKGGAGKPKPTAKPEEKVRDAVIPGEGGAGVPEPEEKGRAEPGKGGAGKPNPRTPSTEPGGGKGGARVSSGEPGQGAEPGAAARASSKPAEKGESSVIQTSGDESTTPTPPPPPPRKKPTLAVAVGGVRQEVLAEMVKFFADADTKDPSKDEGKTTNRYAIGASDPHTEITTSATALGMEFDENSNLKTESAKKKERYAKALHSALEGSKVGGLTGIPESVKENIHQRRAQVNHAVHNKVTEKQQEQGTTVETEAGVEKFSLFASDKQPAGVIEIHKDENNVITSLEASGIEGKEGVEGRKFSFTIPRTDEFGNNLEGAYDSIEYSYDKKQEKFVVSSITILENGKEFGESKLAPELIEKMQKDLEKTKLLGAAAAVVRDGGVTPARITRTASAGSIRSASDGLFGSSVAPAEDVSGSKSPVRTPPVEGEGKKSRRNSL